MSLNINLDSVDPTRVQFGVSLGAADLRLVRTDVKVRRSLIEIAKVTSERLDGLSKSPPLYDTSEKHSGDEYLVLPLDDDLAEMAHFIHTASNLPRLDDLADEASRVKYYFARMTDEDRNVVTAVRKASTFKVTLNKELASFLDGELKLVNEKVFQLDREFGVVIDSDQVHMLWPGQFDSICEMGTAILAHVPRNVEVIASHLPYVDFGSIQQYSQKRPRAAQLIVSIRKNGFGRDVEQGALIAECIRWGVEHECIDGQLKVADRHIILFLEMLDERLYEGGMGSERRRYRASSRTLMPLAASED